MEPRVIIGIPHVGDFTGYFTDTLLYLKKPAGASVIRVENKAVDLARNMIVEAAMQNEEMTHVFFMDSDMVFPGDTLNRLLSWGLPVVSGLYFARTDTPIPHLYDFGKTDDLGRRWYRSKAKEVADFLKSHPERHMQGDAAVFPTGVHPLVRCDAVATGCLLVAREVFEKIPPPWFKCWPETAAGEDFYFCDRALEQGFPIWADLGVQCAHEARPIFTGAKDFEEVFGIGTPQEHDFDQPVWVETGPRGRVVRLDRKPDSFVFPDDVEGYCSEDGGRFLFSLAQMTDRAGLIVELGSYKGKSAICLAQAGRQVWTVDHGLGEALDNLDDKKVAFADHVEGNYTAELKENLVRYGVADNVRVFVRPTKIAPNLEQPEIDLLYIDAAHDYESVRADFDAWVPFVKDDGIVVFDDANFPGVAAVLAECGRDGWRYIDAAAHMIAVAKPKGDG